MNLLDFLWISLLVGGSLKTTVKATGFVIKKTGQGVVTTGKFTGKTGLAVATLDRKGLMEAIRKNKKKERGCVEGFAYRRKSLGSRDSMGPLEEEEGDEAKRVKGENRVSPTAYKEIEHTPVVLIGVEMSTPQSSDKLVNEKSEPQSPGRADKKTIIEGAIPQLPSKTKGNIKIEAAVPFQSPGGGKGDDTDKIAATLVPQSPGKEKNKVKANLPTLSSSGEESKKVKATIPRSSDKEKNKIQATTLVPPPPTGQKRRREE
jgi:hypothetical protein